MAEKLTVDDLAALCDAEIADALDHDATAASEDRERAIEYFLGEVPDVGVQPGRSSVTSHDVADTIGWILPGLMRVFTGTDKVVTYQPSKPGDEGGASQATEYVNFVFMNECDGYQVLWDAFQDALLVRNGILKVWWDDTPIYSEERFSGLSDDGLTLLASDDSVEIVEHEAAEVPGLSMQPGVPPMVLHSGRIRRVEQPGRLCCGAVPREEFLISRRARSMADADFVAHRRMVARADLIAAGYDRETVLSLPTYAESAFSSESLARDEERMASAVWSSQDPMRQEVEIYEAYIRADQDGKGQLCWHRMIIGARTSKIVLDHEKVEDHPFQDVYAERVAHRWEGRSVFDDTADIQRVKTVVLRQMLDNLYLQNNPQREVVESQIIDPDEVLSPKIGGVVRVKSSGAVREIVIPFVGQNALLGLEYADQIIEKRTGVSRSTMALDPQALTNQTATAVNASQMASYSKIELIARNMAECLRQYFRKVLKIVVANQDRERVIRLRDQWVPVDPRSWNASMDCVIDVGLGTGSRDRDMMVLQQLAMKQEQILAQLGPGNPLVSLTQYRATLAKIVEAAGIRSPETFFGEITPEVEQQMVQKAAQAAQDPRAAEAAAKMRIEEQRLQIELQKMQAQQAASAEDRQMTMAIKERELQLKQQEIMLDMMATRAKLEVQLAIEQANAIQSISSQEARVPEMQVALEQLDSRISEIEGVPDGDVPDEPVTAIRNPASAPRQPKPSDILAAIEQANAQTQAALAQLAQIVAAPKQVVRDQTGRVVGVQTVRG
jgi:hypothetical protein